MKRKSEQRICYLCGKKGAGSKDHVPPKCLLPKDGRTRLTLWAHAECNVATSADEEYLRDVVGPAAIDFPDGYDVVAATFRSWSTPQGARRREMFMRTAEPVDIKSKSGEVVGGGWGIRTDHNRMGAVAEKIARGIVFHDSGIHVPAGVLRCGDFHTENLREVSEKELDAGNPIWWAIVMGDYMHQFGSGVLVRAGYYALPTTPIQVMANLVIVVYSVSFIVSGIFLLDRSAHRHFRMMAPPRAPIGWVPRDGVADRP
ncbi:MAG: hypothetical protein QOK37_4216 [Thermoanaerobaculia bacterium]|jgi:hypothetical protein|nr:hypothetical protein [Thermoanaerobaculia bacterium]